MSAERPSLEPFSSDAVLGRGPRRQHTELGLRIYLLMDSIFDARINSRCVRFSIYFPKKLKIIDLNYLSKKFFEILTSKQKASKRGHPSSRQHLFGDQLSRMVSKLKNKSRAYKVTAFCVQTVCGPPAHKVGTQNGATRALKILKGTSRAWSRKDVAS